MKTVSQSLNPGQIIIFYAIGLLVLLAVAVLALDGGMLFLNRRAAQAAADAGALAGARVKCTGGNLSATVSTAINYATTQNGATTAAATVDDFPNGDVVVEATIQQNSFFARVFGTNQLNIKATSAANCFPPNSVKNVLPIAWACRPPVLGGDSKDCEIQSLDWTTEMKPLIDANNSGVTSGGVMVHGTWITFPFKFNKNITQQVYIIMDSNDLDFDTSKNCLPIGTINCDFDGDGFADFAGGGDRSWLLLEPGTGAAKLKDWLQTGLASPLSIHTWLAGEKGVAASIFQNVDDYVRVPQKVALLPVFNDYCINGDFTTEPCLSKWHLPVPGDEFTPAFAGDKIVNNGINRTYFHVIGFAEFFVTCVDQGNSKCPAHDAAVAAGIYPHGNSVKSIEGYFVRGVPVQIGPGGTGGVDLGINVRSLTR
jgi:hypothetical protein